MTSYNPIISSYIVDVNGTIHFCLPSGSRGWKNNSTGTWEIIDISGFSISKIDENLISISGNISETNFFYNIEDKTFKFFHPNYPENKSFLVVLFNGVNFFQDSMGNWVNIRPGNKISFIDQYVEAPSYSESAIQQESENIHDTAELQAYDGDDEGDDYVNVSAETDEGDLFIEADAKVHTEEVKPDTSALSRFRLFVQQYMLPSFRSTPGNPVEGKPEHVETTQIPSV
ncbi:uncharacterized protein I206_104777 [Kwoniella pini CBS 10737]|uniref:Uncharacterized protein n=1 Tax=Kwoniella pini CBS 10737 TaxID=1296096 RepID=A0A1B9I840_9TREE|nr:uncharacterized protein I206_02316 [Kwoniella pini CBS 10737]OCF51601.1 hypothetical protein I206_02316 [Kwoniella pini CBS 10737]